MSPFLTAEAFLKETFSSSLEAICCRCPSAPLTYCSPITPQCIKEIYISLYCYMLQEMCASFLVLLRLCRGTYVWVMDSRVMVEGGVGLF